MFEILETKEHVLADNEAEAEKTRAWMKNSGALLVNLMGSPGAGKTSVLLQLIRLLGDKYRIGVMEADVDSDVDARTMADAGVKVIQLHTAGLCHMDADMTRRGLEAMGIDGLDRKQIIERLPVKKSQGYQIYNDCKRVVEEYLKND